MIRTCTRCGNAYDASEEQANESERFCPTCSLRQQLAGAQVEIEKYRLREFAAYQALGYAPPVSDALPHLIECMMGLKASLQENLDRCVKASGWTCEKPVPVWECIVPRAELDRLKAQVKPLVEALEQCIKQCDYMPAHKGLIHAKELGL